MPQHLILFCVLLALSWPTCAESNKLYQELIEGRSCRVSECSGAKYCTYSLGKDLELVVSGAGLIGARIEFAKAVEAKDLLASFSVHFQCALVERQYPDDEGEIDVVFISPRTGEAYIDAQECRSDVSEILSAREPQYSP